MTAPIKGIEAEKKMKTLSSYIRTLAGENGKRFQAISIKSKAGFSVYALYQEAVTAENGKKGFKTIDRGVSTLVNNYEEARVAVDRIVKAALTAGWTKPAGPSGFKARPDAFTLANLPSPKATVSAPAPAPVAKAPKGK